MEESRHCRRDRHSQSRGRREMGQVGQGMNQGVRMDGLLHACRPAYSQHVGKAGHAHVQGRIFVSGQR